MNDRFCSLFEPCKSPEAPLCPLDPDTIKNGIWYPDEPICKGEKFQQIGWIKKQKQIAALKLKADRGFFTVRMLNAVHMVTISIKGADPDEPQSEQIWFNERDEKHAANKQQTVHKTPSRKDTWSSQLCMDDFFQTQSE